MKLTIGMAHHSDFDGVYFSIQALRLYQDCRDVEFLIVDNSPETPAGEAVKSFLQAVPGARYIPAPETVGTAAPRNRIFREAAGEVVLCMDCHVLLVGDAIGRLKHWFDSNPDNEDLVTGPLIYDNLIQNETHFNLRWSAEMWGVWGTAWGCPCGAHFSILEGGDGRAEAHDLLNIDLAATECKCLQCGKAFPAVPYADHQPRFAKAGFRPLAAGPNDPPFEIPAQGLGLFACRKRAWLGFNPHFRGFGGEEGYIHIKYRQAGRHCLNLPFLGWDHRFPRVAGVSYPLALWDKTRNYVIGHQELGLSLDSIYEHFVTRGNLPESQWTYLMDDPIGHVSPPGGCGSCGNALPDSITLEDLYQQAANTPSASNEHAAKLRELAAQCDTVVEFAHQRNVSTVALLAGQPARLLTYDSAHDGILDELNKRRAKTEFQFGIGTGDLVQIPDCDMLFEDSADHSADHVWKVLERQAPKVRRFLVFHDTHVYGETFNGGAGILPALRRFMQERPEWSVIYHSTANHGLTILGRLPQDKPKLPSLPRMAWNYAKAIAKHQISGQKMANEATVQRRLDVCLTCDQRADNRCAVCGCFLDEGPDGKEGKATWAESFCPLGKWGPEGEIPFYALYYSHNLGDPVLLAHCLRETAAKVAAIGGRLITVTRQPVEPGDVRLIYESQAEGHRAIYAQILQGLAAVPATGVVCLVEHDVLYPDGYFAEMAAAVRRQPDRIAYNVNVQHLTARGFLPSAPPHRFLSNAAAMASVLRNGIEAKIKECEASFDGCPVWAEPGGNDAQNVQTLPVLDVRDGHNFTGDRGTLEDSYAQSLEPWGDFAECWQRLRGEA